MNFAGVLLTFLFTMMLILPLVLVFINNAKIEEKKAIEKQKELESAYKELESAYKELEYSKKAIADLEFKLHQEHNDFPPSSSFSAEKNLNSSVGVYTPTQTESDEKEKLICSISSYRNLAEDYLKNQNYSKAIEILKQRNGFIMDPKLFQHWRFSGSPEYELMRLPIAYMMNCQPEIADKEAEKIKDFLKTLHANNQLENFNYIIYCSKRDDKDLVYLPTHYPCCGECAKYQGRIYSISGKDNRFPKLPNIFYQYGSVHPGCLHQLDFCYAPDSYPVPTGMDIYQYSNRPFVDDRTPEDIFNYEYNLNQKKSSDHIHKLNYTWCQVYLPDVTPKSFSAYQRMRNAGSKKFLHLQEIARANGREI